MLQKRFEYDKKPVNSLNELQIKIKKQIEEKIKEGIYSYEKERIPCCVCVGNNFETLSEKDRYGLYLPVVICKDCGLIQTNPRMKQESYNQFYDFEYTKLYKGETPTKEFFKDQYYHGKRIYHYLESNLGIKINNLTILEVGTGAGGILQYFKEKGNKVYGCDLGSEYIDFGREKYGLNLFIGTIDDIKESLHFDIIIYSHVLEHLLNPIDELIKLKSIVGKDSYIYIEVPSVKYFTRRYKMDFLRTIHIAHVYYFTLTTLINLLEKADYDLVAGDEYTCSIFKSSNRDKEYKLKNDYYNTISFLKKMEFYRFLPIIMSILIRFLKCVGLYSFVREIYHKFK